MDQLMLNLRSWPQAILHIDGDAFFTSCEEAIHPELKGKPLITGGERGREPRAGDVVVAQVDGEWTMKYFTRTKSGAVVLESANPKYPPIRAREELKIAGIVSAVVRKYHL